MARLKTLSANAAAALDMLAWCEGTSTHRLTRNDGYDVIVTGIGGTLEILTDYSAHPFEHGRPAKQINSKGLYSTASGRSQFILRTWIACRDALKLPDFTPESQDRATWYLITGRRANLLIEAGHIEDAIKLMAPEWASLPGANYANQGMRTMAQCIAVYELKGGKQWTSLLPSSEDLPDTPPLPSPPLPPLSDTSQKPSVISENPTKPNSSRTTLKELFAKIVQWLNMNRPS